MTMYAITGANGFIGRHLVSYLDNKKLKFIKIGRKKDKVDFLINDLNKNTDWTSAFKDIEIVFHLAARVHFLDKDNRKEINKYEINNSQATEKLILDAYKSGVKKIIYLSTIKVNGEKTLTNKPFTIDCSPNPQNPYAISKLNAEYILLNLGKKFNIDITIIRVPLVFGPEVKANFFKLIKLIQIGIPLPFINIQNKRSYIYVENLVDFMFLCSKNSKAIGKTFLLSEPESISTVDLIKKISFYLGKKPNLFYLPIWFLKVIGFLLKRTDQIDKFIDSLEIDTSKAYKTLKWKPPFSSEKAFKRTIDWYLNKTN
tara:strand:+ start:796 stop:1737 length:942 start_codon:yes stop_codon:yes gene_type:complete